MKKMFLAAALLAVVSLANAQAPANAPYGVKSGVITMSMDMMGNEMITETYFDDYGLKTAQVSEGGFMGGEGKTRTITDKDGAQIRINDAEKTATKFPAGGMGFGMGGGNRAQINWNNLTDQVKKVLLGVISFLSLPGELKTEQENIARQIGRHLKNIVNAL